MKKLFAFALLAVFLLLAVFTVSALATDNGEDDRLEVLEAAEAVNEAPGEASVVTTTYYGDPAPSDEPALPDTFTWGYLLTTGGAAVFVYFIVRFAKAPLDKVWKIPTRLLVYVLCLATLLIANTFFNHGINGETAALCVVNALISAYGAYGMYEVWDKKKPPAA